MKNVPNKGNLVLLHKKLYIVGDVNTRGIVLIDCHYSNSTTYINFEPKSYKVKCPECYDVYGLMDSNCETCKGNGQIERICSWTKDLKLVADNLADYLRTELSKSFKGIRL